MQSNGYLRSVINNMKTNTYFVADNKQRFAAIWQTTKARPDALDYLTFSKYDIFMTCEDTAHAQELLQKGDYQLVSIEDFTN